MGQIPEEKKRSKALRKTGSETEFRTGTETGTGTETETEALYSFLEKYAGEHGYLQMSASLVFAAEQHKGQFRSGKKHVPYLHHPLMVALQAITLGFEDEDILSACLLHDVAEDCGVLISELPVGERAGKIVALMTRDRENGYTEQGRQEYYSAIAAYPPAVVVKLLDRISNLSDMASGFSIKKMSDYMKETRRWIYPYFAKAEEYYPEKKVHWLVLKSRMDSIGSMVDRFASKKTEDDPQKKKQ